MYIYIWIELKLYFIIILIEITVGLWLDNSILLNFSRSNYRTHGSSQCPAAVYQFSPTSNGSHSLSHVWRLSPVEYERLTNG